MTPQGAAILKAGTARGCLHVSALLRDYAPHAVRTRGGLASAKFSPTRGSWGYSVLTAAHLQAQSRGHHHVRILDQGYPSPLWPQSPCLCRGW